MSDRERNPQGRERDENFSNDPRRDEFGAGQRPGRQNVSGNDDMIDEDDEKTPGRPGQTGNMGQGQGQRPGTPGYQSPGREGGSPGGFGQGQGGQKGGMGQPGQGDKWNDPTRKPGDKPGDKNR